MGQLGEQDQPTTWAKAIAGRRVASRSEGLAGDQECRFGRQTRVEFPSWQAAGAGWPSEGAFRRVEPGCSLRRLVVRHGYARLARCGVVVHRASGDAGPAGEGNVHRGLLTGQVWLPLRAVLVIVYAGDRLGCKAEHRHPIPVYLPYLIGTGDERRYRVTTDRESWFRIVMGQEEVARIIPIEQGTTLQPPQAFQEDLVFNLGIE